MTLRARHGNARQYGVGPVVETLPVDELPAGVPDPHTAPQPARDAAGRFLAGTPQTKAMAAAGGRSRAARTHLAHTLGVSTDDPIWARYLRQAEAFRRAQVKMLAQTVGGGMCGPAPAALVASAALALAASRYAYSQGDLVTGQRLATEVRSNLLGAHELAAREAQARPRPQNAKIAAILAGGEGTE